MSKAEQIKSLISIPQVLRMYGIGEGRHRRIPCPLHGGKDANFAYTDKVYHCWTCGAKGDAISLVMAYFNLGFGQAVVKINSDFQLGLTSEKPTYRSQLEAKRRAEARKSELARKELDRTIYLVIAEVHAKLMRFGLVGKTELGEIEDWLDENIEMAVVK